MGDDSKLGALAIDLMQRATINQLRDEADELAKLFASLDPHERERLLVLLLGGSTP